MEKIDSIRKGQIWLTVFRMEDGQMAVTICKSYPTTQGWKTTNFLKPEAGDIRNLLGVLQEFNRFHTEYSKGEIFPLGQIAGRGDEI